MTTDIIPNTNCIQVTGNSVFQAFKTALIDVLEERGISFAISQEEASEDIALIKPIEKGEDSEIVNRDEVFSFL